MYNQHKLKYQAYSEYKYSLTFHFGLCCHSNKTRAPIANPPNSAQLGDTPYHSPKLHLGPCSSMGMRRGTDRHADVHDQYTIRYRTECRTQNSTEGIGETMLKENAMNLASSSSADKSSTDVDGDGDVS